MHALPLDKRRLGDGVQDDVESRSGKVDEDEAGNVGLVGGWSDDAVSSGLEDVAGEDCQRRKWSDDRCKEESKGYSHCRASATLTTTDPGTCLTHRHSLSFVRIWSAEIGWEKRSDTVLSAGGGKQGRQTSMSHYVRGQED